MATVNRYTNVSVPRYTPRTLQELMLVPAYKRQNHDTINESIAGLETQLSQYDGLDIHSDALKAEQERLYSKMTQQADQLEKEGYNPSSKSNFLRFNKEYQQAVGPQGQIGRIGSAKKQFEIDKENLIKNGTAMGYGPDQIQAKIDQKYQEYTNKFKETGKVVNFEAPMPPAYENLQDDIVKIGSVMGSEAMTKMKASGYKIGTDPTTGLFVITTADGSVVEASNDVNIKNAIEYLNKKWIDEGGTGTASSEWQNLTKEGIKEQINSGLGLQRDYKYIDDRKSSYQFIQPKAGKETTPVEFLNDILQGINASTINPNSPLLLVDKFQEAKYNDKGELDISKGNYKTFEDKLNAFRKNNSVKYNSDTGNYEVLQGAAGSPGPGQSGTQIITKDWNHMKDDLKDLRVENPALAGLSDKELIGRMTNFRNSIKSNYITSNTPIGASYEWMTDRLFGNKEGTGEKGAGIMRQKGATLSGKEITYDQVYDELGYDSYSEFRVKGNPTLQGYVPAMGKWQATAYNKKGEPKDIFIQAESELQLITKRTTDATNAMLEGKTFADLGAINTTNGTRYLYLVNDFANPMIIATDVVMTSGKDLNSVKPVSSMPFQNFAEAELMALQSNSKYISLSGVDKTSK